MALEVIYSFLQYVEHTWFLQFGYLTMKLNGLH